jgi:hypothetical protein
VWTTDLHGRNSLIGYGTAFIPFQKGMSNISISCWRPSNSLTFSFSEFFLGNTPEFHNKSAIYSVDEKFGMLGRSTGNINIEIDIIMKDFQLHGIG